MCSSAHFACRDCNDVRGWGLGCKDIICSFGKISDAGRKISAKHYMNGLWKLPQEKGVLTVDFWSLVVVREFVYLRRPDGVQEASLSA